MKNAKNVQYGDIIFLQNSDSFDGFKGGATGFFNAGDIKKLNYLAQWDYGDVSEVRDKIPAGSSDTVFKYGKYVLIYNRGLGYAGLSVII